ncbi:MAG TPA: PIN domain-containing protein [Tepidisphaeraceae bacterium]|nr:PIN domain-containing protein [Tepidisphaeraceae bacterium]
MTLPPVVFADAGYYIARLSRQDAEHRRAVAWRKFIDTHRIRIVTTEAVLWEWLNFFAVKGRQAAFDGYRKLHAHSRVSIVPFDADLVSEAVEMYGKRPDQEWGVTDCLSFVVMQHRGLVAALTFDHLFVQAGFTALLLQNPPSE